MDVVAQAVTEVTCPRWILHEDFSFAPCGEVVDDTLRWKWSQDEDHEHPTDGVYCPTHWRQINAERRAKLR